MEIVVVEIVVVVVVEGRNWILRCILQLKSYHDEMETCNREEIPPF